MRRWYDKKIIANHFVEWQGHGVKSVKNGFARAVEVAKLDVTDGNVTPHTLRHMAATWLMQLGTDPWEAAGYLGMSVTVLIDTYGHHHPDYMKEASGAITRKRETTKRVVGTPKTTKPAVRTRSIRAIQAVQCDGVIWARYCDGYSASRVRTGARRICIINLTSAAEALRA